MNGYEKLGRAFGSTIGLGVALATSGFSRRRFREAMQLEEQKVLLQLVLTDDQRVPALELIEHLSVLPEGPAWWGNNSLMSELEATKWVKRLAMRGLLDDVLVAKRPSSASEARLYYSMLEQNWDEAAWET